MNVEIQHLMDTALRTKTAQLKQVLSEHGVPEDTKDSIFSSMGQFHDHITETFQLFKTPWRVESYLQQHFDYIAPKTVKLGSGSFQFVSVKETVNRIREDKTFRTSRKVQQSVEDSSGDGFILEDIEDGLHFKKNKFFQKHPNALRNRSFEIFILFRKGGGRVGGNVTHNGRQCCGSGLILCLIDYYFNFLQADHLLGCGPGHKPSRRSQAQAFLCLHDSRLVFQYRYL